jgi:hypothetical protein
MFVWNMHCKVHMQKNSAMILATFGVVRRWFCHLLLCDQIFSLRLVFAMHLVVMIRQDKNFTDTNHLNQYLSF